MEAAAAPCARDAFAGLESSFVRDVNVTGPPAARFDLSDVDFDEAWKLAAAAPGARQSSFSRPFAVAFFGRFSFFVEEIGRLS